MILNYLTVFLLAMIPLVEQRLAIPFGIFALDMDWFWVTMVAILGNFLSIVFVLAVLPFVVKFLRKKWKWCNRLFTWLFAKTHKKHSNTFIIWGDIFLVFFVILPIPGSGGWMGALISYVFGFKYWQSIFMIFLGLFFGGFLVASLSLGIETVVSFFAIS